MSDTPIKFKHGELENLDAIEPSTSTEGTVYVAKTTNNRAYMYADFDGVRYDITSPNRVYYGTSSDESQIVKTATAENFILEPGATVTILFTTPLYLNNATLNVNSTGNVAIVYRGSAASNKSLPANSVYTFIYINSQFHLIGDLDQVNNGIAIRTTQLPDNETPILIAAKEVSEDTKSITAATNPAMPITANIVDGIINAPGGFQSKGPLKIYNAADDTFFCLDPQNGYINWWGTSPNSGEYGDWYFYNDGTSFTIEDANYAMYLSIDSADSQINSDWRIQAPELISTGAVMSKGYRLPNVYYGTTAPLSSLGEDGDIYIMYS